MFASEQLSVLGPIAEKARRLADVDAWAADLADDEGIARTQLQREWAVGPETVHRRLRMTTFEQIGDPTLRHVLIASLNARISGDADSVLGLLRGYIEDHFAENLTADAIWGFLRTKGHHPTSGFSPALSERVRETVVSYVSQAGSSRPAALGQVVRSEARQIIDELQRPDGPPVVVLAGKPGSGKSHVLADVCNQLASLAITTGVLRLDVAQPAQTAAELGAQQAIGFDGSPVQVLARASAGNRSVLVVDQADSASMLSGRGHTVFGALRDMLQQARSTAGMKVLIACRSEDLRFDQNLRRLINLDDPSPAQVARVDLGDLTSQQVQAALASLGIDGARATPGLLKLTANVLNLALFVRIYEATATTARAALTALRTRLQLLREYHGLMAARMLPTLGPNVYAQATMRIAKEMSDKGTLSVGRAFMAAESDTLNALIHHGVIVDDHGRLRFFHEAMFDYLAALSLRATGQTATNVLAAGPQELLRRGQVRAMLTLAREESSQGEYLADVSGVLDGSNSRSHIRAAVLSMLSEVDEVWDQELELVLQIASDQADPMHKHALGTLTTEPMARRLADSGLLDIAATILGGMSSSVQGNGGRLLGQVGAEDCGHLLVRAAASQPNAAASAALAVTSNSSRLTSWLPGFLRLIHLAGPSSSGTPLSDLFVALARAVTSAAHDEDRFRADIEVAAQRSGVDRPAIVNRMCNVLFGEGRFALATIAERTPSQAPLALRGWLEAAASINATREVPGLFHSESVLGHRATGLGVFNRVAEAVPRPFVEAVLPVILRAWEETALEVRWTPTGSSGKASGLRYTRYVLNLSENSIEHEVTAALFQAAAAAANTEPAELAAHLGPLHGSELLPVHELLGHVYGVAEGPLLEAACKWVCDPRVRGLHHEATIGWAWGSAAARVAAAGTIEQRDRVLACVRGAYSEPANAEETSAASTSLRDADTMRALAHEELVVISRLKAALGASMPADLDVRIDDLAQAHGPAPDSPATYVQVLERQGQPEVPLGLSDAEWTAHIECVTAGMERDVSYRLEDKLYDTTTGLSQEAAKEPVRFARLGTRLPMTTPAPILTAILRGVAEGLSELDGEDADAVFDLVRAVLTQQPIAAVDLDVLRLIQKLAAKDLPADIIAAAPRIFDRNPPPEQWPYPDLETAGLNHPRGAAITTAAGLLSHSYSRGARLPQLAALLTKAAEDEHAQVRVWVPMALTLVHLEDADLAGSLVERWLARATDQELAARYLDRLTWQLAVTSPAAAESLLGRMVTSSESTAKRRAGQLATLFDVRGVDVGLSNEQSPLTLAYADDAGRRGIADVIVQLVDDLPATRGTSQGCPAHVDQGLLIDLANDGSDDVRAQIMDVGRYMRTPLVDYDALLGDLAGTAAFQSHPGRLFHFLSQRLDELPPAALKLCQKWADRSAAMANNMANREAAEAYDVTDILFGLYVRTESGSVMREECLKLIDLFVELRIGDIERKVDDALYEPSR
ncbi:hypothetical protein D7223_24920 [Micromonospora endolithica]|uniref:AAA+ ATPase domain-containing protein n=1 Tax=Micromonospora endolithica TaxID=230091 RepID=A0A3A9YYP9_9ACTN|nr:hypothetical protein D7223_24920 [Micromonospora endolithica]